MREALVNKLIHGDDSATSIRNVRRTGVIVVADDDSVSVGILVQKRPDGYIFQNPGHLRVR